MNYGKLYTRLPVSFQNLAVSAYGFRWKKRRFGGIFSEELKEFKQRENFSAAEWQNYLTAQLRVMLLHAFDHVPYYRESFTQAGIKRAELEKFELTDLNKLPYLSKQALRLEGEHNLLSDKREYEGEFFASSGSTGTPTQILFSYPMHQRWSAAFEARIRHWAGVNKDVPRGMIGGRRVVPEGKATAPFYRYNYFEKQTYFSAYHISAETVRDYVLGMKRNRVAYMTGYAMSNYFLARFIKEAGLKAPQLQAVITSSEKLTDEMRSLFAEVYGCKTFDSWSGVEACALVSECEHGSLHISEDVGVIELLDDRGKPVEPGQEGEVVCTGLLNFDQPLIRYKIGDRMRLGSQPCKCGRSMPTIEEIIGRVEDTVIGPDGREMVRFHGIFVGIPKIIEAQVIQLSLTRLEIKLVTMSRLSEDECQLIVNRMQSQLGEIDVEISDVDSIPRTANGKFKSVISHINRSGD